MDAARWQQVQELVGELLDLPDAERRRALEKATTDDPQLRQEAERLLAADAEAEGFLSRPAGWGLGEETAAEPDRVGPYRIERRLHAGGMGEVFLATRDDEEFERRVAVKRIRGRLDDPRSRRWFRAERQMLARLEHPNIARLYDGGTTEDGQPYLAMEYVDGLPLDVYCAEHRLSTRDRIELVLGVCDAVRHAHQNLLIHRDLKPANILVTPEGEPKLLDFGIAKELPDDPDLASVVTVTQDAPRTLGYSAPEQITGRPVRTTTDVHALGILLWELLVGRPLFGGPGRLPHQVEHAVCEDTPPWPSEALAKTDDAADPPRRPPGSPSELRRQLRGDLDAIVAKALRKDPNDRYPSVEALADDLRRHLENQPVKAVVPSRLYRLRKTWQRHRIAATTGLLVAILVVSFTIALLFQARALANERDASERALDFFIQIFQGADPTAEQGQQLTVVQALEGAREPLLDESEMAPASRARLLDAVAHIYLNLGEVEFSEPVFATSLEIRRQLWPGSREEARGLYGVGKRQLAANAFDEARQHLEEAVALYRRHGASAVDSAATLQALADTLMSQGEVTAATEMLDELVSRLEAEAGPDVLELAAVHESRVNALRIDNREQDAIAANRRAAEIYREGLGAEHPRTVRTETALAVLLAQEGELDEAHQILTRVLEMQRRTFGDDHPSTLTTLHNLASNRLRAGELDTAERLLAEAISHRQDRYDLDLAMSYYNLTAVHLRQGRAEDAQASATRALELRRELLGDDHAQTGLSRVHLAEAFRIGGEAARARSLAERGFEQLEAAGGPEHSVLHHPLMVLGRLDLAEGELDRAAAQIERALAVVRERLPADHWRIALGEGLLGARHLRAGDLDQAEALLAPSREVLREAVGPEDLRFLEIDGYWRELARQRSSDR